MRGDKSFAYDLLVRPGRVSGRVALLLRSTERKPVAGKICERNSLPISVPPCVRYWRGMFSNMSIGSSIYFFVCHLQLTVISPKVRPHQRNLGSPRNQRCNLERVVQLSCITHSERVLILNLDCFWLFILPVASVVYRHFSRVLGTPGCSHQKSRHL